MNLEELYNTYSLDLLSSRALLIDKMNSLESAQISCINCSGVCCTQSKNSMQLTLVEALTLYMNLKFKNILNDELILKSAATIKDARIDQKIYVKNRELRRNYTCPLFMFKALGCPLDKDHKPYGCLGFNATTSGVKEGENCQSDLGLLKEVDETYNTKIAQINAILANALSTENFKMTIPEAIVFFNDFESKNC